MTTTTTQKPKYKLTYFNVRGLAEPIRYLLAYGNLEFEDVRIEKEQWPDMKSKQPFGKLPVLEFEGVAMAESQAITRYLAKELGIAGKNNMESATCDMLTDAIRDCCSGRYTFLMETDETKKSELKEKFFKETAPIYLSGLEARLKSNGGQYFVGDGVTWADLFIAYALQEMKNYESSALDAFPLLQEHSYRIHEIPAIKAWVERRPKTEY